MAYDSSKKNVPLKCNAYHFVGYKSLYTLWALVCLEGYFRNLKPTRGKVQQMLG